MTTFALVHGAWHGAWCWDLLRPLLQQQGHDVIAMDLPSDDSSASFEIYADVICSALDECDHDVVLIGHSLGGVTLPLVAARRPVRHLVYLCAFVPDVGRSLHDQMRDETDMLNPAYLAGVKRDHQSRTSWVDLDLARASMYADCDEPTATAALNRLRPHATYANTLPFTLAEFPPRQMYFHRVQGGSATPSRVVETNCARATGCRSHRTSRKSLTIPLTPIGACRRSTPTGSSGLAGTR